MILRESLPEFSSRSRGCRVTKQTPDLPMCLKVEVVGYVICALASGVH